MGKRGPKIGTTRILSNAQLEWAYDQWKNKRYSWVDIAKALGIYYQLLLLAIDRAGYDRSKKVRTPLVVPDELKLGVG